MNDTLRCKCGGAVVIVEGNYNDETGRAFELYECESCGQRGTFQFGNGRSSGSGCLADV